MLGFTESQTGVLGTIPGFIRLIPGTYKSEKPINISESDKILLKSDCINGSFVNGVREAILYSFALSSPPGQKLNKNLRIKFVKRKKICFVSYNTVSTTRRSQTG